MKKRLGELLIERRLITPAQLADALAIQRQRGIRLGAALVRANHLSEDQLVNALGAIFGVPVVDLTKIEPMDEAIRLLSMRVCSENDVFAYAIKKRGGRRVMTVAMADPLNVRLIDELGFMTDSVVEPVLARASDIDSAIRKAYGLRVGSTNDTPRHDTGVPVKEEDDDQMTILRPGGREEIIRTSTNNLMSPFALAQTAEIKTNPITTAEIYTLTDEVQSEQIPVPSAIPHEAPRAPSGPPPPPPASLPPTTQVIVGSPIQAYQASYMPPPLSTGYAPPHGLKSSSPAPPMAPPVYLPPAWYPQLAPVHADPNTGLPPLPMQGVHPMPQGMVIPPPHGMPIAPPPVAPPLPPAGSSPPAPLDPAQAPHVPKVSVAPMVAAQQQEPTAPQNDGSPSQPPPRASNAPALAAALNAPAAVAPPGLGPNAMTTTGSLNIYQLGALLDARGGAIDAEAFQRLERRFWALMRLLAAKGVLTNEEFVRELGDDL